MIRRGLWTVLLMAGCAYAVVYVVNGRDPQNRGGAWMVRKTAAFTTTMGVSQMSAYSKAAVGANLLSMNYYTEVYVDTARDSVYTLGLDSLGLFADSAVSGTGWTGSDTACLYLDGFVDEQLDVIFFFTGTSRCTTFVTVEQAFRYDTTLADSGFNYGFFRTDTLFTPNYDYDADGTNESVDVPAITVAGGQSRIYRDTFSLIAPCLRLKIVSAGLSGNITLPPIMIELYPRHGNQLMSGTSGRLLETKPASPPGVRTYDSGQRDR